MLNELSVLGDVVGLCLGPPAVMAFIEHIALGGIWQRCGTGING